MITRHAAADFILSHPDDFLPFLPSPEGEDGQGATGPGMMSLQGLQKYCDTIRNTGTWGGEPEITALARTFRIPIQVVQWGNPSIVTHLPESNAISQGRSVMISYHRRMYGLGEVSFSTTHTTTTESIQHYNSLRPIA
jgi:OTU domain-containing protein 6